MQLLASEVSADSYTHPPGNVSLLMLTISYIQAISSHMHTQGRFNSHTPHNLYRVMVMATSIMGVMKRRNIVPRERIEMTSLAFQASVLIITPWRLLDVHTLPMPTCLHST